MTSTGSTTDPVYVGPTASPALIEVVARSNPVVEQISDADVVIWTDSDPASLPDLPDRVSWVQLPAAGVEKWIQAGRLDARRTWTSMAGAYATAVAEHAIAMLLAGVRGLVVLGRWRTWRREQSFDQVGSIAGSTVAIVGAGAIGRRMIPVLKSLDVRVVAVNRRGQEVEGADRTFAVADLPRALERTDHLVVAAPETDATRGLIDSRALEMLSRESWVVNVGRAKVIDQVALVQALSAGSIGGAALDVTDPEPLPDNHILWTLDNVLITPHTANPPDQLGAAMVRHVAENLRRWNAGLDVITPVDPIAQY